jgi:hypothetical protein
MSRQKDGLVPEVMYLMDPNQLIKFLDMFGGRYLYVPTREEFAKDLEAALFIYYRFCEGKTTLAIQEMLNIDGNKLRSIQQKVNQYIEFSNKEGLIPVDKLYGALDVNSGRNT